MRSKGSGPVSGQLPLPGGTPRNLQHARKKKKNARVEDEHKRMREEERFAGWIPLGPLSCHVLLTETKTIRFSQKMRRAVVVVVVGAERVVERVVERVGGGFQAEPSARKNCRLCEITALEQSLQVCD